MPVVKGMLSLHPAALLAPQLLLVGGPSAGKTTFTSPLSASCKVYKVPTRKEMRWQCMLPSADSYSPA